MNKLKQCFKDHEASYPEDDPHFKQIAVELNIELYLIILSTRERILSIDESFIENESTKELYLKDFYSSISGFGESIVINPRHITSITKLTHKCEYLKSCKTCIHHKEENNCDIPIEDCKCDDKEELYDWKGIDS